MSILNSFYQVKKEKNASILIKCTLRLSKVQQVKKNRMQIKSLFNFIFTPFKHNQFTDRWLSAWHPTGALFGESIQTRSTVTYPTKIADVNTHEISRSGEYCLQMLNKYQTRKVIKLYNILFSYSKPNSLKHAF